MNDLNRRLGVIAGCVSLAAGAALAADWPQWRGANRDARVSDFKAPQTWPKELTEKWKSTVGSGDATPALVGDKIYVFTRQGSDEVTLCLDAADGKEVWQNKYPAIPVTGPGGGHPGPRSSPAVGDGKVITFGVGGVLSCLDAGTGKVIWRKESAKDFSPAYPMFFTSMSPLIVNGMCVAHLGGQGKGAVVAFDLNTGETKWTHDGEGPAYSSPVVMTAEGGPQIVDVGEKSVVGLSPTDGKLLWQMNLPGGRGMGGPGRGPGGPGGGPPPGGRPDGPPPGGPGGGGPGGRRPGGGGGGRGMGMSYNAATPIIDGQTVIISGQGIRALTVEKQGDGFAVKEAWANPDASTSFNSPILKDGRIYGLSGSNSLFCLDAKTGKTLWSNDPPAADGPRGPRGFGNIVDAGSVLLALTPSAELTVFQPSDKEYTEVAKIKVAEKPTYAYPVIAGNRIVIKSEDAVTLFALE